MDNSLFTTSRVLLPVKRKSINNNEIKEKQKEGIKDYYTIYFIESHLQSENEEIEISIDSSIKYLEQLKKINQIIIKDNNQNDFIINVFSLNLKPNLIKKKEIKEIEKIKTINLKIYLKKNKTKFESNNLINIEKDNFLTDLKFVIIKGWFGKEQTSPKQLEISILQIVHIFNETLLIKEKIKTDDKIYLNFIEFGLNKLEESEKYELELYLILYINILNGNNYLYIKKIFDIFEIEKISKTKVDTSLLKYQDKLDNLYKNQIYLVEKLEKITQNNIYDKNLEYYLIKFYTIYIYFLYILGLYQYLEEILKDIRDNNKINNLILPMLYLSDYSIFYKSILISNEMKKSLINKFIYASKNYNDLLISFSFIKDYVNRDFVNILFIITENYDKINEICIKEQKSLQINEYVKNNNKDDLNKIKEYLNIIITKINKNNYKAIEIDLDIWSFYLYNINDNNFFNYLKYYLIQSSLIYNDIENILKFLSKYENKNFISILEIIVNNYQKIENICFNENKSINIKNYITQANNDDYSKIKEYLEFILSHKKEKNFETISFDVSIIKFFIEDKYPLVFLKFLETKLFQSSINYKDISDSLIFSSNLNEKQIIHILDIIINNFDNINYICKKENTFINLEKYISKSRNDELSKIKELISIIINKEKSYMYNSIKFDIKIWIPYLEGDDLDNLKMIKKIIIICKEVDNSLDEENINLGVKIHNIGFDLIKKGKLNGEKLILFLGEDEAFYLEKKNKKLENENDLLKQKNIDLNDKVGNLLKENKILKNKVNILESNIENLYKKMNNKIEELNGENVNLKNKIKKLENYFSSLEKKVNSIK